MILDVGRVYSGVSIQLKHLGGQSQYKLHSYKFVLVEKLINMFKINTTTHTVFQREFSLKRKKEEKHQTSY